MNKKIFAINGAVQPAVEMQIDKMEEVKLIGTFRSPFVYRVIWALKLKGIDFEFVEEDLSSKSDLLLKYNPVHKKVPVLVHGGKPIAESTVILEYIEEKWPEVHPLLPEDSFKRAQARFWTKFGEDKMQIIGTTFFSIGDQQQASAAEAREVLKTLEEQALGDKKFFNGDKIGMTDLAFGWISQWLQILEEAAGVKVIEDMDEFPRLKVWMHNFKEAPVIKDNLPDPEKLLFHFKRRREIIMESPKA